MAVEIFHYRGRECILAAGIWVVLLVVPAIFDLVLQHCTVSRILVPLVSSRLFGDRWVHLSLFDNSLVANQYTFQVLSAS